MPVELEEWLNTKAPKLVLQDTWRWRLPGHLVISCISVSSKIIMGYFNKVNLHNADQFLHHIHNRPKGRPLLTVSNHMSMVDDCIHSYILPWKTLIGNRQLVRWLPGAFDICFRNSTTSMFFLLGKVIPVKRGGGIHQPWMDFCIDRLSQGDWIHVFPEGQLIKKEDYEQHNGLKRIKWGIGRLVSESSAVPLVIPYWHVGMDDLYPTVKPYRPHTGQTITVCFGDPIDFQDEINKLKKEKKSSEYIRKYITDRIQEQLGELKVHTEKQHKENIANS